MNCIDICLKGTVYGISAVYDQMIAQGEGQVINLSSIYANFPVSGAGVYQACKVGVQYIADSLRSECQGKTKVTTVKPTGVPRTGLMGTVVDQMAGISNLIDPMEMGNQSQEAPGRPDLSDINNIAYNVIDPAIVAENIVYVINQPTGMNISDVTVRGSGDLYCL